MVGRRHRAAARSAGRTRSVQAAFDGERNAGGVRRTRNGGRDPECQPRTDTGAAGRRGRCHCRLDRPAAEVTGKTREIRVGEWIGVAIALVSSCLGGTAAAITRYLVGNADPITLAILRWGIGFACLLPAALLLKVKWPPRRDWPAVAALGVCFFGLFFVLYNIAIGFTTAARASLALATLPLHTMVVGALLGIEPLTLR